MKMPSASVSITAASAVIVQLRDKWDEEEIIGVAQDVILTYEWSEIPDLL